MITVDFTDLELEKLITHHVGNKLRDEKISFSSNVSILDESTRIFLLKYFILPLKSNELFSFFHSVELSMNDVYLLSKQLFKDPDSLFIDYSQNIAKLLYEQSMHPKIKEGELNIAYFSNICLGDKVTNAIGIFKSENNVPYLKMNAKKDGYIISHDYGYAIKGIDKGCIILNTDSEMGFYVLISDNENKAIETQYWKDDFLKIQSINDEYYKTKEFLNLTKDFVSKRLLVDSNISKADKIDLLNRSVEYFKKREVFNKSEFEEEVFQNDDLRSSFKIFDKAYREENKVDISDSFNISSQAVKKQARAFKNVLKLDKNFDIYIHGSRDLMEQGVDENGRKYYKIYYQEES